MDGKVTVKAGATGKKKDVPADAYKLTYTSSTTPVSVGATITTKLVETDIKNKNYTTGTTEVTVVLCQEKVQIKYNQFSLFM